MRKYRPIVLTAAFAAALAVSGAACRGGSSDPAATGPRAGAPGGPSAAAAPVKPGVEVLLEKRLDIIQGKRIGLITNPSGVDSKLRSTVDLLRAVPGVKLVALYAPEHGVRGNAQAGEYVPFYMDEKFKIPVFSLYGPSMKPPAGMLRNIDEYMRSFDTTHADKKVAPSMTKDVDVLIYDIQDVGTRVYTYEATMAYAMQAAAEAGMDFVVLDRPNPITGRLTEGPILEYPAFSSFVGLYPVPLRFGLTIGELARLYNDKFLEKRRSSRSCRWKAMRAICGSTRPGCPGSFPRRTCRPSRRPRSIPARYSSRGRTSPRAGGRRGRSRCSALHGSTDSSSPGPSTLCGYPA
jgi:hypothetical protein